MLQSPATPLTENETTCVLIPESATAQAFEDVLEDVPGRINIIDNVMYRDMPECLSKAAISSKWGRLYGNFESANNIFPSEVPLAQGTLAEIFSALTFPHGIYMNQSAIRTMVYSIISCGTGQLQTGFYYLSGIVK